MRIISYTRLREFIAIHPNANVPLNDWHDKVLQADWQTFSDIKQTFNSVDYIGDARYVFNVGGNNFRLVAMVLFKAKRVYVKYIGTHKEYEKIDCKNINR